MGHSLDLDSTGYPRKQKQGGWSQRRFQARADERVDAFARGIADEVQTVLDDAFVTMLVVAGDEVITSALDAMFHPSVKERIIDTIRLDIGASEGEIIAATLPIVERAEREREVKAVNDLDAERVMRLETEAEERLREVAATRETTSENKSGGAPDSN